jgi:hypothetical protein
MILVLQEPRHKFTIKLQKLNEFVIGQKLGELNWGLQGGGPEFTSLEPYSNLGTQKVTRS